MAIVCIYIYVFVFKINPVENKQARSVVLNIQTESHLIIRKQCVFNFISMASRSPALPVTLGKFDLQNCHVGFLTALVANDNMPRGT